MYVAKPKSYQFFGLLSLSWNMDMTHILHESQDYAITGTTYMVFGFGLRL